MIAQRSPGFGVSALVATALFILVYFPLFAKRDDQHRLTTSLGSLHPASSKDTTTSSHLGPNTDLILYSYFETEDAERNLAFFQRHALHSKADFIFMLNGEYQTDISYLERLPNVRIVKRPNRCFDLGGFHEILTGNRTLTTAYKRFIFMNASLKGPFFPAWARNACWSDEYWNLLDARTKMVGMTWNCANGTPYPPHIQSMILAFSRETLNEILLPDMKCYEDMHSAIAEGETRMAGSIMEAGYDVFAMENRFTAHAGPSGKNATAFLDWCIDKPGEPVRGDNDLLHSGNYEGSTLHPYETIFAKTNRDWNENDRRVIDVLTKHQNEAGYSSWDRCL